MYNTHNQWFEQKEEENIHKKSTDFVLLTLYSFRKFYILHGHVFVIFSLPGRYIRISAI